MEKKLWEEQELKKQEILENGNFARAEVVVGRNGYTDPIVNLSVENVTYSDVASLIIGLKQIEKSIYKRTPEIKREVARLKRRIKSVTQYVKEG